MFYLIFSLLLPAVFSIQNCTIQFRSDVSVSLPDQVICKKNETYTIIEVDPDETGAKCLDGSNYKFMIHEGSGDGKDKFLFYFMGAAYCGADGTETLESCYDRSFTDIGSSTSLGANGTIYEKNMSMGYVSSNPEINPLFWNWNIIFNVYCDGTNGQGYLEYPLYYNNTPIWFRGFNNTFSIFEYARKNMNLFNSSEVMIAGASSGGAEAMVWVSYLQDYFPSNIKMYGFSDGGLFMDLYSNASGCYLFRYYMQNLAYLTNASALELYKRCRYHGSIDTVWKCMIPQYIYKNIDVEFFIANSQYDEQQLATQLGVTCLMIGGPMFCSESEISRMTHFREQHLRLALKIKKNKPLWGFWLRTCFEHTYHFTWAWYGETMNVFSAELGKSLSLKEALEYWYHKGKNKTHNWGTFIDMLDWKHNPYCVYDSIYRDNANATSEEQTRLLL